MDDDAIWTAIHAQRAALADILETLTEDEWARDSLCSGWTVRDVAAHVISSADAGLGEIVLAMAAGPGQLRQVHVRHRQAPVGAADARRSSPTIADSTDRVDTRPAPRPGTRWWMCWCTPRTSSGPCAGSIPMPPEVAAAAGPYVWGKGFPYNTAQAAR